MNVLKYRRTKIQKYKSIKVQKKERSKEEMCERRNVRICNSIIAYPHALYSSVKARLLFLPFCLYSKLHIVLFLIPFIIYRKEEPFFVVIVGTANSSYTIALKAHVWNSEGGIRLITILAVHLD